jgi:hypothetical protein
LPLGDHAGRIADTILIAEDHIAEVAHQIIELRAQFFR